VRRKAGSGSRDLFRIKRDLLRSFPIRKIAASAAVMRGRMTMRETR